MSPSNVLAVLVVFVGAPLTGYVAIRLRRLSHEKPTNAVLRYQSFVSLIVFVVVVLFGLIFLNNDLGRPLITSDVTKVITRTAVLALSIIPALYWLRLYR